MNNDIEKLAYNWIISETGKADISENYYCQTRDVFKTRLSKMTNDLLENSNILENRIFIISAVAGEIGNNSFDHNLGNWTDVMGIFFGYNFAENELKIVLADRGQGILKTLKRVKPELKNDLEALQTAFTERISARAPESRGNGLKFSRENVQKENMRLVFISGAAQAKINEKMEIKEIHKNIKGCFAILKYNLI